MRKSPNGASNRIKLRKNVTKFHLFPETSPLTSVSIDIIGEFIKTQKRNEYLSVITDLVSTMTKTGPMKGISGAEGPTLLQCLDLQLWSAGETRRRQRRLLHNEDLPGRVYNNVHPEQLHYHVPSAKQWSSQTKQKIDPSIGTYLADHSRD